MTTRCQLAAEESMENGSNAAIARPSSIPILNLFALMLIALGVVLYLSGVGVRVALLAAGIGAGLLLWAALSRGTSFRIALFFLLIFVIVFSPPLPPFFGTAAWRLHQLALVVLAPFIIFWRRRAATRVDVWIVLFSLAIILSMLMGAILGNPPLLRDWFELAKPGFWWLAYSFGLGLAWRLELKERALWILLGIGIGTGLLALAQFLDWGGVNSWLSPVFVTNEDLLVTVAFRVGGTFGNPNRLSSFMTVTLDIAVILLLFSRQKRWLRWILILYVCGSFAVILMTGSRFGFVAGILSVALLVLIRLWSSRISLPAKPLVTGFLVLVVALAGVFLVTQVNRQAGELSAGEALLSGNPLTGMLYRLGFLTEQFAPDARRMTDWQRAWELGWEAPIFGVGPSKGVDEQTYFHSEYLLVFRRYGFVGLIAFLFLYGNIALSAYRSFQKANTRQDAQQQVLALSTLMAVLVFAAHGVVSNAPMSDFQLSATLWWLIGVFYGSALKHQTRTVRDLTRRDG